MGSTNHGTQTITYEYFEEAAAEDFNKYNLNITQEGIYNGGHLKKVSNSEVTLSPFVIAISDGDELITVQSANNATLNNSSLDSGSISSATPYLVFRWDFAESLNNYVEVHAIDAISSAESNDIIIGKLVFSGATLTGFDYSDRTMLRTMDAWLKPEATEDTELYIWIRGGYVQTSSGYVKIAEQKVGPFTAPTAPNSRVDLVYINTSGVLTISQGVAAPSPSAPSYSGKLVLAEVTIANGATNITNSMIRDVRSPLYLVPTTSTIFGTRTSNDSLGNPLAGNLSSGSSNKYMANADGVLTVKITGAYPELNFYMKFLGVGSFINTYSTRQNAGGSNSVSAEISLRQNDVFYVNSDRATGTFQIYWMPIGTGSLVKQ